MGQNRPQLKVIEGGAAQRPPSSRVAPEDVLVGIPVLNEAAHIESCLASLMTGDPRLQTVRFLIADGGSTDGTRDILDAIASRHDNVDWIDNPGRLQSAALNLIAGQAGKETILVRCDAHSVYPPGYVMQVADALRARDVASLVVPMDAVGLDCFQKANAWVVDTPLGSGGSAHRGGTESKFVDHGHHAGFDLAMFRSLGGYDESFSHNEDAEYDARVAKAGGKIFLDAEIRLVYRPRDSVRGLARQYFGYGKGRARTLRKHAVRPRLRQLFPLLSLAALLGSVLVAPFHWIGWVYPAIYFGALAITSTWLALRHRSACGLLGGLAALTMHMSWAAGFARQWLRDALTR